MKNMKNILLALCDELSKKKPDQRKVDALLLLAKMSPSDDPIQLTNEVLKKLHTYEDASRENQLQSANTEKVQDDGPTI